VIEEERVTAQMLGPKLQKRFGKQNMTAMVHTFGCQQNVADSERMKGILAQIGFTFTEEPEKADLILFNTCAIRENAEDKVFGNIGNLKQLKADNPSMLVILCGCMTEQPHVVDKLKKSFPYVDLVFGTHSHHLLASLINTCLKQRKRIFDVREDDGCIAEGIPSRRDGSIKAWLSVMYGCDNFCSYCVVPYVRGRERSRRPEHILAEARQLVAEGYKDITLLGQNVNSYGKGLEEQVNFSWLLRQLNEIPGDFRIRFMTSHPKDCTRELIDTIAACEKVCNHIHLPVQSGSDEILSQMNRRYTVEKYLETINHARARVPDFSFTTDIIVGFPNESAEDFEKTLELMKRVKYDNIYSFIYSKRSGTKAAEIEDMVSDEEKGKRMTRLLSLQREISTESYKRFIGRTMRVLVDGKSKTEGYMTGKSNEFVIVEFEGDKSLVGSFVNVKITDAKNWAVTGVII